MEDDIEARLTESLSSSQGFAILLRVRAEHRFPDDRRHLSTRLRSSGRTPAARTSHAEMEILRATGANERLPNAGWPTCRPVPEYQRRQIAAESASTCWIPTNPHGSTASASPRSPIAPMLFRPAMADDGDCKSSARHQSGSGRNGTDILKRRSALDFCAIWRRSVLTADHLYLLGCCQHPGSQAARERQPTGRPLHYA